MQRSFRRYVYGNEEQTTHLPFESLIKPSLQMHLPLIKLELTGHIKHSSY